MADLTQTATSVIGYGEQLHGVLGGTVTAGMPVRLSSGTYIAATDASAVGADVVGIGATLAVGKVYVLSTAGAICPVDDIAGSEFVTVLGIATTASIFKMGIVVSGVAAAGAVS
jgi:hypothetical protein